MGSLPIVGADEVVEVSISVYPQILSFADGAIMNMYQSLVYLPSVGVHSD